MVDLFSKLVANSRGTVAAERSTDSRMRLNELLSGIPENQLLHIGVTELARELHCSERHLSRMFKAEVGVSFRSKQTELRLEKAKHLLISTNDKIINIALECGYRHLGLFSVLFRRRFRVAPSELRRRSQRENPGGETAPKRKISWMTKKTAVTPLLLPLLLLFSLFIRSESTQAQTTNTAVKTIRVLRYEIEGNTYCPRKPSTMP